LSEDSIIIGKIKLTADVRTNRIHVVTRPVNMAFVRKLIQEFDTSVKFGEPVSRTLKYISVADVLDVVVKAITDPGMKEEGGGGGGSKSPSRSTSTGGTGGAGSTNLGGNNSFTGGSTGGSGTGNVSEELNTQEKDTTPEARVIGTTKIIADKNANAIIVIGGEDVKNKVFRLLDHLDQRIPQVMLNTVIGELNLDHKDQFGVDYIIRNSGLGISPIVLNGGTGTSGTTNTGTTTTNTGSVTTTTPTTTTGTTGTTGTGTTGTTTNGPASNFINFNGSQPGLNLGNLLNQNTISQVATLGGSGLTGYFSAGNSLTAVVTALQNSNRFRVVSRPSVFTRNNKKAIIASGEEIAVPTNIQSSLNPVANTSGIVSNSSVEFKTVTLQLEVVPLINSDREVSLDILQKEDEVSGSTQIDNNAIPTIATRYVKTSVTVPNQATLVLGGLIKVSNNHTHSGVPWLSNIPVLGYLFSNTTKEKIRQELVILIRPEVSWAPPEDEQLRQRAQEFFNLPPDLESSVYPKALRVVGTPAPKPKATPRLGRLGVPKAPQ
jgi:type II secretory pathway component GspD/PulD (secretin)